MFPFWFAEIRVIWQMRLSVQSRSTALSTTGPGRRDICHLTDFSQTFTDD